MADVESLVQAALLDHLPVIAAEYRFPISYENRDFTKPAGNFYETSFQVSGPDSTPIGWGDYAGLVGLLQVTLVVPKNTGSGTALRLAGKVRDHYARGTLLSSGGVRVRISREPTLAGIAGRSDERSAVPVTIPWVVWPS